MTAILEISPGQIQQLPILEIPDFGAGFPKTSNSFWVNSTASLSGKTGAEPTPRPFWGKLVLKSPDGSSERILDGLYLEGFTENTTVSYDNDRQAIAARVHLAIDLKTRKAQLNVKTRLGGSLARQCLESLRFQETLERGGTLLVLAQPENSDEFLELFQQEMPIGECSSETVREIQILEDIIKIESRMNLLLRIPTRDLPIEEIREIRETAQIVTTGELIQSAKGITLQANREFVEKTLKYCEPDVPFALSGTLNHTAHILDETLELGKVEIHCLPAVLTAQDFNALQRIQNELEAEETTPIHFNVPEGGSIHWTYPEWKEKRDLPPDVEKEALRERIAKVVGKYSSILSSSDEFAARKNEEFDIEQRRYAESEA